MMEWDYGMDDYFQSLLELNCLANKRTNGREVDENFGQFDELKWINENYHQNILYVQGIRRFLRYTWRLRRLNVLNLIWFQLIGRESSNVT